MGAFRSHIINSFTFWNRLVTPVQTGAKQYQLLNHAKEFFGRVLDDQQHAGDNANTIDI